MRPAAVLTIVVEAPTGPAASSLGKLQGTLKATTAEAAGLSTRMRTTGASLSSFGSSWNKYVALPVAALGGAAIKSSVDFTQAMNQVYTQAGSSRGEVSKLHDQVLNLAKGSIFGPTDLANSLYHIESVGFRGAKAMNVLNAAQKAATVGNSDLESTTYALVSALNTGIKGTGNMTKSIALMDSIVGHGDMRMEDFTAALSTGILPSAKAFGLSLRDVGSALDVMTARGTPAQAAATRLRMTFSLLGAQTDVATAALEGIGIKQGQLGEIMQHQGLVPAVQLLSDKLKQSGLDASEQAGVISHAFGGGRSSSAIMTLIQNVGDLKKHYDELSPSAKLFNDKLKVAENSPMNKLKEAWSSIQVALVKIGDDLVPVVVPAFEKMAGWIGDAADAFASMPPWMRSVAIDAGLAAVSFGMIFKAVGGITKMAGTLMGSKVLFGTMFKGGAAGAGPEVAAGEQLALPGMGAAAASTAPKGVIGGLLTRAGAGSAGLGALGIGAAGAGIANTASSAMAGDWRQVGFKGGGEVAGGLVGGLVGGLPGALIGSGIGSILGGFVGDALNQQGGHIAGALTRATASAFAHQDAMHARLKKFAGLVSSTEQQLQRDHHKSARAADAEKKAESQVSEARKKYGPNSRQYAQAEAHLAKTKEHVAAASRAEKRAEAEHGRAARLYQEAQKGTLKADQRALDLSRQLDSRLTKRIFQLHKEGQSWKQLTPLVDREQKVHQKANKAQSTWAKDASKITDKLMPKQANQLIQWARNQGKASAQTSKMSKRLQNLGVVGKYTDEKFTTVANASTKLGLSFKSLTRIMNASGNIHDESVAVQKALDKQGKSSKDAANKTKDVGKAAQDTSPRITKLGSVTATTDGKFVEFAHKGTTLLRTFKTDIANWSDVSRSNVGKYEDAINKALSAAGVNRINFSAGSIGSSGGSGGGSGKNQRTGGLTGIVPGAAPGDQHVLSIDGRPIASVESKEGIFVGHRKLMESMSSANAQIRRFRSGGQVDVLPGVNMSVGDEPSILSDLRALSGELHKVVYVISGYRSPAHSVAVGGFANDPHTQGAAADIGVGSASLSSMFGVSESALNRVGLYRPFYPASAHEVNHVQLLHGGAKGAPLGGQAIKSLGRILLHGPAGNLLSLGQSGLDHVRGAFNDYIKKHQPTGGTGGLLGNVPTGPVVAMARKMVAQVFGASQWSPFQSLEMQEAGFNPRAVNPSSGAAGLAQNINPSTYPPGAWPYTGPESAKLQLQWMLGYIKNRYGNPAGAWAHEQSMNWYGDGGVVHASHPTVLGIGDKGPETAYMIPGHPRIGSSRTPDVHVHQHTYIDGRVSDLIDLVDGRVDVAFSERDKYDYSLGKAGM